MCQASLMVGCKIEARQAEALAGAFALIPRRVLGGDEHGTTSSPDYVARGRAEHEMLQASVAAGA